MYQQKKCPKFACSSNLAEGKCAEGKGKTSDGSRVVSINKCTKANDVCQLSFNPQSDIESSSTCTTPTTPSVTYYPGEKCALDTDCTTVRWYNDKDELQTSGKCDIPNKLCFGSIKDKKCDTDMSCVAGLYCKTKADNTKACAEQLLETNPCTTHFQCKNNLFCHGEQGKQTCKKTFSLALGDSFNMTDHYAKSVGCSSNYVNSSDKCALKDYKGKVSGPIKCEMGSKCNYQTYLKSDKTDTPVESTEDCVCSMNPDGQGWCPYSMGNSDDGTSDLVAKQAALLDNKRHTVSRSLGDYVSKDVCFSAGLVRKINLKGVESCFIEASLGSALKDCSANKIFSLISVALAMIFLA